MFSSVSVERVERNPYCTSFFVPPTAFPAKLVSLCFLIALRRMSQAKDKPMPPNSKSVEFPTPKPDSSAAWMSLLGTKRW
jgi:hypothetical protein